MSADRLLRWGGLSLIVGGVLSPLSIAIHPSQETVVTILGQTWRLIAGHILTTASIIFILLGMLGLYVFEADKAGRLGLAGFLLAFTGNVLLATSSNYGYIAPVLAAHAPAMLTEINAYGPEIGLDALMVFTYIPGFVLLGIATVRAGKLPRLGGVFISAGAVMFFIGFGIANGTPFAAAYWIGLFGQVLFGLGFIVLGRKLWMGSKISADELLRAPIRPAA
jgi:hypothetical protein